MVHKSQTSSSCQVSRLWRASLEHLFVQKRHSSHGVRFHWQSVSADGPGLLVLCCPLWSAADFKQQNHKITNLNFLTEAAESQHLLLLCEFKDDFFFCTYHCIRKWEAFYQPQFSPSIDLVGSIRRSGPPLKQEKSPHLPPAKHLSAGGASLRRFPCGQHLYICRGRGTRGDAGLLLCLIRTSVPTAFRANVFSGVILSSGLHPLSSLWEKN